MFGRIVVLFLIPPLAFMFATLISHLASEASRSSSISSASSPVPAATGLLQITTPTPRPDRKDCDAIKGTDYRSETERAWYLANCRETSQVPAAPRLRTASAEGPG